jgi:GGDEF domain-containing protein
LSSKGGGKEEKANQRRREASFSRFGRIWLALGPSANLLEQELLASGLNARELPRGKTTQFCEEGDLILLSPDWEDGNAFLLASRLKSHFFGAVFCVLVCPEKDFPFVEQIARFCMVDFSLGIEEGEEGVLPRLAKMLSKVRGPLGRKGTEELLAEMEGRMDGDVWTLAERVTEGLSSDQEMNFLQKVTDPDTGLFSGPYMAFKLEEEFKRTLRFRSPLSVVLLDLPGTRDLGEERAPILGRVAGIFLNECRDIDVVGRYDSDSFLFLLPQTGASGAKILTSRILDTFDKELGSDHGLNPAIAIVSVPRTGISKKDELLDLARLTLMRAWSGSGETRVQIG